MKTYFCWKCKRDMPFLDEYEWSMIEPHLKQGILDVQQYRKNTGVNLIAAQAVVRPEVMALFSKISGMENIQADVIFHYRLKIWGAECMFCGHLLRTPQAEFCAHCGQHAKPNNF